MPGPLLWGVRLDKPSGRRAGAPEYRSWAKAPRQKPSGRGQQTKPTTLVSFGLQRALPPETCMMSEVRANNQTGSGGAGVEPWHCSCQSFGPRTALTTRYSTGGRKGAHRQVGVAAVTGN